MAIIGLTVLTGVLPLAVAWVNKLIFDLLGEGLAGGAPVDWAWLWTLLALSALFAVLSRSTAPVNTFLNAELSRQLTLKVQRLVFDKLNSFRGIAYFENPKFYDTIRLAQQGVQRGAGQVLGQCKGLIQGAITLVGFLSVLLALSPLLALLLAISALPQLWAELKFGRERVGLAFGLSPNERRKFFYGQLLSSPQAAKEVRLFNLGDFFLTRMLEDFLRIFRAERRQQLGELKWNVGLGSLSSLVASVALVLVILQAFAGLITLGDLTLFIAAVASVQGALSAMVSTTARMHESVLFYDHYETLRALPPSLQVAATPRPVPKLERGIELRNVWFRYTDEHPWILKGVDLVVPAGKAVALVGLNGAGKTTLVKLLTRLYDPVEGAVLWDGIDIREFDVTEYRRRLGAVMQDFMRYDLSARENIGLGDVAHIDNLGRIEQAARKAGIHEVMAALPMGFETILSRMLFVGSEAPGTDLSGGEWQRLALARMFMREAEVMILDEPTAAMDARSEFELFERFATLVAGRTSLLISHRFSTVRMADLIAVLEGGKATEFGRHDELMERGGSYAELYTLQAQALGLGMAGGGVHA